MKKQFLALAVASTFVASACAAQVEIYGNIDLGLLYTYDKEAGKEADNTFKMASGVSGPSRVGFRGTEDLGNGYSVSFKLENGYNADTGTFGDSSRMFNRECRLSVVSPFGELAFGRMGTLNSSTGSYEILAAHADVYDGGWAQAMGSTAFYYETVRMDNAITYVTPTAAGFTGYFQYSGDVNSNWAVGTENKSSAERYIAAGFTYANGPLTIVSTFESALHRPTMSKSKVFSLGGNYKFPACTVYLSGQIGRDVAAVFDDDSGLPDDNTSQVDGYWLSAGAAVPCAGGTIKGSVIYGESKQADNHDAKVKTFNITGTYEYALSKRTTVYSGVGYLQAKDSTDASGKDKVFQAVVGMHHAF